MKNLRDHLLELFQVEHAHPLFDRAVQDLPPELRGKRPDNFPHSAWELVEHIRISQWDILEYVLDPEHVSPDWPSGYWPKSAAPSALIRRDSSASSRTSPTICSRRSRSRKMPRSCARS